MAIGRLDEARGVLEGILGRAELEGLEYVRADVLLRLSSIASRTGDPVTGARLAADGLEIAEQLDLPQLISALLYGCSFAAMYRGDLAAVTEFARRGQALSAAVGDRVYLRAHEAVRGATDLAAGDYQAAVARLRPLVAHLGELGRRFESHWVPEIAEALVVTGELGEAGRLLDGLEERYRDPCTLSAAARGRGVLAAAAGLADDAIGLLTRALELRSLVSREPVAEGRIHLQLGALQRRVKQRRAARENLGLAIELFDGAHAALWAARARAELARVSGRPAAAGELTATEHRVAELIAAGLSNRAAAAELFVSVRAIESTLTKVYAKLGVRSRMELASRYRGGRA
jgi:ATP/maltotriose-dependent transcriptional regulator MalT